MGTLYLVRHGQASFGAADYDNLSELGHKQSARLGEYWRERRQENVRCTQRNAAAEIFRSGRSDAAMAGQSAEAGTGEPQ